MSIDVSVVVPVYNTGKYIEPCIDGLFSQSLPRERYEILFIDDGSTDDTPARLDRLAAEHPDLVKVVHQPNSGWPGKPRNVGTDLARGDYVFFHDHDDKLSPEALERMVAMARRTKADIVIPKMISRGRPVPLRLVRANIDRVELGRDPIASSLTPHKLFRREFIVEKNLRWVEGRIRLEDEMYVMEAYLRADVISVLGDYACYARYGRDDRGNAAMSERDIAVYFSFVERVIDIIETYTEPGRIRDTMLLREYDGKMVRKVFGARLLSRDNDEQDETFAEVRRLAVGRFPTDFPQLLPPVKRAAARAVLADRMDLLRELSKGVVRARPRTTYRNFVWRGDRWTFDVEGAFLHPDRTPILLRPVGEEWAVHSRLIPDAIEVGTFTRDEIMTASLDLTVRNQGSRIEWFVPASVEPHLVPLEGATDGAHHIVFRGSGELDPMTLDGGSRPLASGRWRVNARVATLGLGRGSRLRPAANGRTRESVAAAFGTPPMVVVATPGRKNLLLKVAKGQKAALVMSTFVRDLSIAPDRTLHARVDLRLAPSANPWSVRVAVFDDDGAVIGRRRGHLVPTDNGAELVIPRFKKGELPKGTWRIGVGTGENRVAVLGTLEVGGAGRVRAVTHQPVRPARVGRRPSQGGTGRRKLRRLRTALKRRGIG